MKRMSYAEAYTQFLKYCAKKEDKKIGDLVIEFSRNDVENEFINIYNDNRNTTNFKYYKQLRG